jgi:purine-binding chemotaxis protein CheW
VVIVELHRDDPQRRQTVGVVVDAVHEVADIAAADLEPAPPLGTRVNADLLEGMARLRGDFVPLLALDRVLDEAALARDIAEYAQAHAAARPAVLAGAHA